MEDYGFTDTVKFYTASFISVVSGIVTISDVAVWLEVTAGITAIVTGVFAIKKYFRGRDIDKYRLDNEKILKEIREQELYQLMNKNKRLRK